MFIIDKEELKPGLIIFRRTDVQHRNWYCRTKLPKADRYKTISLKTSDIQAARDKAFDHDADIRFRLKHDVPVFNRPFAEVAKEYLAEQAARAARGEISKGRPLKLKAVIEGSLNDYVGSTQVHLIGDELWGGYANIMSTLNEATKFLSDPQVKRATEQSSFSMEELVFNRTTVYLVIPPERMSTQSTWLRLVMTAALQAFKKHRDSPRRGRCLFLIDEFPALGCIEEMPTNLAAMSGYGIDFALVVQDLHQLHATYGKSAGTILSNTAYKWFCNVGDLYAPTRHSREIRY
ncbi:MAG: type IV secretory system conjugative DNA transfer family protein [Panacagrimonas sp.]